MDAPIDPKTNTPVQVTTGSLPGSRKAYVEAEGRADIRVPFREIALHESSGEPPFRVYDTSGPYSDDAAKIDVNEGLQRLREPWVKTRAVEHYVGRDVKPEDNGNVGADGSPASFPRVILSIALPMSWPVAASRAAMTIEASPSSNWPARASSPRK